uniref:Uncharacterized protein n=1 Tax=viral metagenome TaxID=1070528 RepID=A0A6M3ILK0_9ZZZZ
MLYKNEEPYKLCDTEIEKLVKHFHNKFPVRVVYPQGRIVPSRLKHNRLPDKPNSISFDLRSIVKTDKGSETWRYADSVVTDNKGIKRFTPKKFQFKGTRFLDRNDIELIFFLLKKSEYCFKGDNQGRMVKFMFEDLVSEAEKKAEKKTLEIRIGTLLFGELALSEEKLRNLAKAYFIPGVDNLTLPQVRIVIDNKIHETQEGPDKFFDMVDADEEIRKRVSIQKAVDMGVLKYDTEKQVWHWQTKGDKGITQICKVPPNKTFNEALYDFYKGDDSFRDDLQSLFITKNPHAGKTKGKGGDDIDDEKEE